MFVFGIKKVLLLLRELRFCEELVLTGDAMEKERDLGIVSTLVVGELGEGLLLRLAAGLEPGVLSRE